MTPDKILFQIIYKDYGISYFSAIWYSLFQCYMVFIISVMYGFSYFSVEKLVLSTFLNLEISLAKNRL